MFSREVQSLYEGDLLAIVLYGSAATGDHVPGASDINVAMIVREVTPALLRKAAGRIGAWRRQGFATPLFFDPETLPNSLDAFPIEFLDMQERHRIL
jgi:predicted nucleotidyltransferase